MVASPKIDVRAVLGPGGLAASVFPAWDPREAQIEMAGAILDRLRTGGVLAVEAPTGVGKTLAYLLPAVLSCRQPEGAPTPRVVVSTNTKTLQDQIVDKDLPLLVQVLARAGIDLVPADDREPGLLEPEPRVVRFALMKGRSNYLCLDRLDRLERRAGQTVADFAMNGRAAPEVLERIRAWSRHSRTGDVSELASEAGSQARRPGPPGAPALADVFTEKSPLWNELDARSDICSGARCPRYQECFVVRMRRRAHNAQLVIVNHHLLLADLALRAEAALTRGGRNFGEVIPPGDALILDEAHALEEIASEYFGGRVSSRKLDALARDFAGFLAGRRMAGEGSGAASLALDLELTRAVAATGRVFAELPRVEGRLRIPSTATVEAARHALGEATAALTALSEAVEAESALDPTAEALGRRARDLRDAIGFALSADDPDYVYWTERQGNAVALGASPINVARILADHFYPQFGATILTSATLAAGDTGCRYFLRAVGAPEDTPALVLGSPFDYPRQAALYLPRDAPDPDAPTAALDLARIAKGLIDLVGGGALFLFTSRRAMQQVHAQLRFALDFPVLMQGERPQRDLLRDFVDRSPAVLFATASFWEGVDIPGDPLRLVLIDRLPFASPSDPLAAARAQRIEAEGASAFNRLHLPRAILRLKQGFGRLIRGKHDRGVVALLDRRVQTRGYGKRFLRALPEATHVHDLQSLQRWLASGGIGPPTECLHASGGENAF